MPLKQKWTAMLIGILWGAVCGWLWGRGSRDDNGWYFHPGVGLWLLFLLFSILGAGYAGSHSTDRGDNALIQMALEIFVFFPGGFLVGKKIGVKPKKPEG
jgi:hypothetical protein